MNFTKAFNLVNRGRKVRREGWEEGLFMCIDGYDIWLQSIYRTTPSDAQIQISDLNKEDWVEVKIERVVGAGGYRFTLTAVEDAEEKLAQPKVTKKTGLYMMEAVEEAKKGAKIRRAAWTRIPYDIKFDSTKTILGAWGLDYKRKYTLLSMDVTFSHADCSANDWEVIYEEEQDTATPVNRWDNFTREFV